MFIKKIPIIYLTKDKIKVVTVKLGKEPKVIKSDETDWNKNSLTDSFKQAKNQLKTKTIRLLLADDLSYVLQLNIPLNTKSKDERKLIEDKIKTEIPEILEDEDWYFKETGRKTQSHKQIIAFAPIKSVFTLISQALTNANLKVEAIEPEVVSKIRNTNPLIGIALKKDIEAKDGKKMTGPDPVTKIKDSPSPMLKSDKTKANKTLFIVFVIALALGALVTGGILVQKNALENQIKPSPTPFVIISPDTNTTPTPTPTPTPPPPSPEPEIELTDQVLNGTGGKGVAGAVKDILEAEGFEDVDADNADKLDHLKTTVQFKADIPNTILDTINRILSSDYNLEKNLEPLTDDNEYDVIITIGKLIKEE